MPDFPKPGVTAAEVWANAARTLTALTGQPRTDLLGEDDDFEGGAGARKANLDTDIASRADGADYTGARAAKIDAIQNFTEEGGGTLTADGTLQEVREYVGVGKLHAYIDLSLMGASDTVVITQSLKIKNGGSYRSYASQTFSAVQTDPLLHLVMKPGKWGVKIELQQTAKNGGYKDFDWETFVDKAA